LDSDHQWEGQKDRPQRSERELCASLGVGGYSRGVIVGSPRDDSRAKDPQESPESLSSGGSGEHDRLSGGGSLDRGGCLIRKLGHCGLSIGIDAERMGFARVEYEE